MICSDGAVSLTFGPPYHAVQKLKTVVSGAGARHRVERTGIGTACLQSCPSEDNHFAFCLLCFNKLIRYSKRLVESIKRWWSNLPLFFHCLKCVEKTRPALSVRSNFNCRVCVPEMVVALAVLYFRWLRSEFIFIAFKAGWL